MSETAKQRIAALGSQLSPQGSGSTGSGSTGSFEGMPAVRRVAGTSNGARVQGKVVIVTGTNSIMGIGRATAHLFAEGGARAVYLCDYDSKNLDTHRRELASLYPAVDVHVRQFDAADERAVRDVVDHAMQSYGRLDVFFANAGIVGPMAPFTDISKDDFMKVMDTNTASVFLAAKYAAPAMMKTSAEKPAASGSIIGTASVAGLRSNAGTAPYSASKAAVVSLAQSISYQLSGTGVRINAVCPGLIETGMTAPTFETARARGTEKKLGQLNPLKRAGIADEVARVVLFLGSDEASYVNGQAWAVDGGLSAGHPYVLGKMA
ncbi:putative 3-oxoacyl-[acyl-carrier protein] reductase [Rosellinia necatrix]|uniref:Putative 3-oxoacyl-[acyl-carrier protein] reductase n=1 Tax=Rosellinia necatrix TaxID=77044 RepID=A0A1S7UK56_ROSNE|nr:putative 3-oxoacyl-[acyl-carrier protein] reductase [Rosellinia necatrix]